MFSLKRNQIIVTALVIMVAVAGYLNLQENKLATTGGDNIVDSDLTGYLDNSYLAGTGTDLVEGEIGIATGNIDVVNIDDSGLAVDSQNTGQAVFVSSQEESSYFVQAKLDREQARSKRKDMLMEMLESKNVEQEQKAACANEILNLQDRIEKETASEAMIEAKGFSNVYVRIDDNTVDVVISKEVLTEAEIAQVEDIVKRKTGFTAEQIRISPLKQD